MPRDGAIVFGDLVSKLDLLQDASCASAGGSNRGTYACPGQREGAHSKSDLATAA
jgi:hypothetical protein